MKCLKCRDYEEYIKDIIGAQMLAWNHGMEYKGEPFKFCPWCGGALELTQEDIDAQNHRPREKITSEVDNALEGGGDANK
jgi:hypothetical protein